MKVETKFDLRDKVTIDGDADITATVIAINVYEGGFDYKLAWMHNGSSQWGEFDEFRLTRI